MTEILLIFWILSAVIIILARKVYRVIICFGVFSLISSVAYLVMGAPDVAMAEAAISAFATIFFIICIERFYGGGVDLRKEEEQTANVDYKKIAKGAVVPLIFAVALCGLFIYFMPAAATSTYLKDQYLSLFMQDVGGENAVTAIYLGYRVYDTLFEALILVAAVVAVSHMSWYDGAVAPGGRESDIKNSAMAKFTMRIISPIVLIVGAYLIMNGHISAGGGFQGGLAIATFFICRYMVYDIYDMPVKKVMKIEELVFINITIIPILAIFMGFVYMFIGNPPLFQEIYLTVMNILIGLKVACGFFILFYRYIAIERLSDYEEEGVRIHDS